MLPFGFKQPTCNGQKRQGIMSSITKASGQLKYPTGYCRRNKHGVFTIKSKELTLD